MNTELMPFYKVLQLVLEGKAKAARQGWNDKLFIFLVNGSTFQVNREPLLSILGEGTTVVYQPHIDVRLTDGTIMTWTPSQLDLCSNDWYLVE